MRAARNRRESVATVVALLREIGARHSTGPTQVALRWLMENNAHALMFSLSPDEVDVLDRVMLARRE